MRARSQLWNVFLFLLISLILWNLYGVYPPVEVSFSDHEIDESPITYDGEIDESPIPYDGCDADDVFIKYPIGRINSSFYKPRFEVYGNVSNTITKEPESSYVVPQTIHTAWMGVPLPEFFRKNIESWVEINPNFTITLWTDHIDIDPIENVSIRDISTLRFINQDIIDRDSYFVPRNDMIRMEILYKFGGIWLDTDNKAAKPFDCTTSRAWVQWIGYALNQIECGNIGAPRGSKLLKYCIDAIRDDYESAENKTEYFESGVDDWTRAGPKFFTKCFYNYYDPLWRMFKFEEISNTEGWHHFVVHGVKPRHREGEKFYEKEGENSESRWDFDPEKDTIQIER